MAALVRLGDADDLLTRVSDAARTVAYAVDTTCTAGAARRCRTARLRRAAAGARSCARSDDGRRRARRRGRAGPGRPIRPTTRCCRCARRRPLRGPGCRSRRSRVQNLAEHCPPLPVPWPAAAREALLDLLAAGPSQVGVWEALDQAGLVVELAARSGPACASRPQRNAVHRLHGRPAPDRGRGGGRSGSCATSSRPDLLLLAALLHDIGKRRRTATTRVVGRADRAGRWPSGSACRRADVERRRAAGARAPDCWPTWPPAATPTTRATVAGLVAARRRLAATCSSCSRALTEADARAAGRPGLDPWRARLVGDLVDRAAVALAGGGPGAGAAGAGRGGPPRRAVRRRAAGQRAPVRGAARRHRRRAGPARPVRRHRRAAGLPRPDRALRAGPDGRRPRPSTPGGSTRRTASHRLRRPCCSASSGWPRGTGACSTGWSGATLAARRHPGRCERGGPAAPAGPARCWSRAPPSGRRSRRSGHPTGPACCTRSAGLWPTRASTSARPTSPPTPARRSTRFYLAEPDGRAAAPAAGRGEPLGGLLEALRRPERLGARST